MTTKHRYKVRLCFEGTRYSGWQRQANCLTLQETLENCFSDQLERTTPLRGSSRTDAGVHAQDFVAHFDSPVEINTLSPLLNNLNAHLPQDIRIISIEKAPPAFHACFSAKKKTYTYRFQETLISPFKRHLITHINKPLCLASLKQGIPYFIGHHNFSAFANASNKGSAKNQPFKTIYSIELAKEEDHYTLKFSGDGFLYKMVRNMVGALFAVGQQQLSPDAIAALIESKDRKQAPPPAPARGLCLEKVFY